MKKHLLMKRSFGKLTAVILAVVMLATALPMSVFAAPAAYREGTLLLQMDSMSPTSVTYNPYGVTVAATGAYKNAKLGSDTTQIVCAASDVYGGVGLKTDLPLSGDTAYTIEYYVKMAKPSLNMGMYMGFCQNTYFPNYGTDMLVYSGGNLVTTHNKWAINGFYKQGSNTDYGGRTLSGNVWETKADEDGFVRFVLTFDGQYMGLSIGNEDIGIKYDLDRPRNGDFSAVDAWSVKELWLQAGYSDKGATGGTITKPTVGDVVVEVKNISIYSGVVNPDDVPEDDEPEIVEYVTFENTAGEELGYREIPEGGLTLDAFPDLGVTNVWGWYNKATGEDVQLPATFTEPTTLVARQKFLTFEDASGRVLQTLEIPVDGLTLGSFPDLGVTNIWGWYNKATGEEVQASETFTDSTTLVAHQEFLTFENAAGKVLRTYEIPVDGFRLESFPDLDIENLSGWYDKATGNAVQVPMTFTESTALVARQAFSKDGPLLLQLSGMDKDAVTYKREDVNVTNNYALGINKNKGNASTYIVNATAVKNGWGAYGVLTDLPLTTDSVYTIEYYVKLNGSTSVFAGLTDNLGWPSAGANVQLRMNGDVKNYYKSIDVYMRKDNSNEYGANIGSVWSTKRDDEGYVRFVMTINKGILSIQIGDTVVPQSWNLEKLSSNPNNPAVKLSEFSTKTLAFCVGYVNGGTGIVAPTNGTAILDVKDISIYEGVVDPDLVPQPEFVTFVNADGAVLRKDLIDTAGVTITSFPEIQSTNQIVWINKKTGKIVEPPTAENPLVLTEVTTFVAYERKLNDSIVLDVQYSEVENGKQNIRFLGGVFNTNCAGVGFEITARYKKADGEIVEMFYRLSGTAVYDAINATENGTMVNSTAYDLGAFYLYGAVLEGVPTDLGQIDFEVKTFKALGKLGLRIYGPAVNVSFKDGVIDNTLAPLT